MKNNLKRFRKEVGLTLRGMVELGACSIGYLCDLEKDSSNPSLNTAYKIAKILDKSVYDIWPDRTKFVEESKTITVRRIIAQGDNHG